MRDLDIEIWRKKHEKMWFSMGKSTKFG
jgi:hypothetical protein